MTTSPLEVLNAFLQDAFDPEKVDDAAARLVADDATYVSLNFSNPELQKIMPWAGTSHGREVFAKNFKGVSKHWALVDFKPLESLVDGDKVALFGSFTLRSRTLDISATSPMAVLAKVADGKITYFQYMEDTFATALTFRRAGTWTIDSDPEGRPFEV